MPTYLSPGVYVEEKPAGSAPIEGVGTAVAAFVGLAMKGPLNQATLISNWKQFVDTFGDFTNDGYLAHAVYGYFLNGGGNCYVVRIGTAGAKDPSRRGRPSTPSPARGSNHPATSCGPSRPDRPAAPSASRWPTPPSRATDNFKLIVRRAGKIEEQHDNLSGSGKGKQSATSTVKAASQLIELVEATNAPAVRPANGTTNARGRPPDAGRLEPSDYVGDVADRTGFGGLETIDEITMVCVPDVMAAYQKGAIDLEGVKAVQLAMIAHCELMADRVAILDPPPDMSPQAMLAGAQNEAGYDSKYAALYWPWIKVYDPASNSNIFVPPSGHVAGIWGRNDDTRGVHKAPGNEVVRGVISVGFRPHLARAGAAQPRRHQLRPLVPRPRHPGLGRPHAVERAGVALHQRAPTLQLPRGVDPQRHAVGRVRAQRPAPCGPGSGAPSPRSSTNEWRKGALFGLTPDEAFYVKCDTRDEPARGRRRRPARLRNRRGTRQAGRVRDLPPRPVLGRRRPNRMTPGGNASMALPDLNGAVGHSFGLEIDGVVIKHIQEVSGLKMEQDTIEMKANSPDGKYINKKLPGRPKAGEITLTRRSPATTASRSGSSRPTSER